MGLRGIAMAGAVLIGASFLTLNVHAQNNSSEDPTAQPAAMTPENQIEADEGDHHEGYYYPKPGSFEPLMLAIERKMERKLVDEETGKEAHVRIALLDDRRRCRRTRR